MRQHLAIAALLTGLAALPLGVAAQEATDTGSTATGQQLPQADMQFVTEAAGGGKAEVELGRIAAEKAAAQEVKDFGQMMVDDHTAANEELMRIAGEKQIEVPDELPPDAQEAQQRLDGLSGAEFDRAYMEQMVTDHEKTITLFEQEANTGQDPDLQKFAQDTLPTLQKHLEQAQQINTQMMQTAGATGEATDTTGSPEAATAPAAGAAAGAGATAESDMPASEAGDTQQAAVPTSPFAEMRADDLIGQSVTNDAGDEIGEIQDIVISPQDQATLAVISVGGFLGIGEKNVAVPFAELQKGSEDSVVISGMTEEQLKQMPAFDEGSATYADYPRDRPLGSPQ